MKKLIPQILTLVLLLFVHPLFSQTETGENFKVKIITTGSKCLAKGYLHDLQDKYLWIDTKKGLTKIAIERVYKMAFEGETSGVSHDFIIMGNQEMYQINRSKLEQYIYSNQLKDNTPPDKVGT